MNVVDSSVGFRRTRETRKAMTRAEILVRKKKVDHAGKGKYVSVNSADCRLKTPRVRRQCH